MMIYKVKGDGLQKYSLCQKGYTYKICMCNDPLPNTYSGKQMLPLHDIVVAFFDTVEGKHHKCSMDNLYNSDAFFKASYNQDNITDSCCYEERNERHNSMRYTRLIEVKVDILR